MSMETTGKREPFRHLERLFELLLTVDPSLWDDVVADQALDPRLTMEARRLLLLARSGGARRDLEHLVTAAQAVLRVDADYPEGGLHIGPVEPG